MIIRHIAVYAADLEKSREFYEKYFGAISGSLYHNPKTGLKTYFLAFDGGAKLELMNRSECELSAANEYSVGLAHISFGLGSREAVDKLTARLESDGYTVAGQPRVTGDGYYESVISGPDGVRIELTE